MTQTESQFYPRVFAVVAVDLLGYVSFKVLKPFFEPLMWAGLLAFLLFPISERLLAAARIRRRVTRETAHVMSAPANYHSIRFVASRPPHCF